MRALGAAVLTATAIALWPAQARATSCGAAIEWNGDTYAGMGDAEPERGRALGTGVVPGCDGADDQVTVHAVRGVDARFAITGAGEARHLFLNTAYPVRLPQHPLHARFYGHRRWPSCRPTRRLTLIGEFESLVDVLRVDAARGPSAFFVDDRTRMAPRFGRLGSGDRVRVVASECRFEGGPSIPFARTVTVVRRAPPERAGAGAIDPDVIVGATITAAIFALGFGLRVLRRR